MKINSETNPIILALDFNNLGDVERILTEVSVKWVKVGLELFYSIGPDVIRILKTNGYKVMLDLKLYDIPTTVGKAIKSLDAFKPDVITVHATGGTEMLQAASVNSSYAKIVAVTVLTSHTDTNKEALIHNLAKNALQEGGVDGIVCPGYSVKNIKNSFPFALTIVPGIRISQDHTKHDQQAVTTPQDAIQNGADYIVMGRSITQNENPRNAIKSTLNTIRDM